jgi:PmbA protein
MSLDLIQNSFDDIQKQARKDQVQVELLIAGGEHLKLGYQRKKLEKYEATQTQMAGFRVVNGSNCGYAYTEDLRPEGLKRAYGEALANSKLIHKKGGNLELSRPKLTRDIQHLANPLNGSIEKMHELARGLEERALTRDSRIASVPYSGLTQAESWIKVLNSNGVNLEFRQSYYMGYSYPLAQEGEKRKCDGDFVFSRSFDQFAIEGAVDRAVDHVLKLLKAQPLKTGRYAVILSRNVVENFMSMLVGSFSARNLEEGNSLLADKVGQKIGSSKFSLIDDPFSEHGLSVRPFDSEGSPSQVTRLFDKGVFLNFLTDLEYSRKMNFPHTASAARSPSSAMGIGVSNLVVEKGQQTLNSLMSLAPEIVYLTNIDGGLHAGYKETTGDFSLPAQGFLVRNGEIQSAVDQFVISGNILELIARIEAVGDADNQPGSGVQSPDLFISELSFAGAH